jgi:pimeloyl-ACP methyl ester carboxylesterase
MSIQNKQFNTPYYSIHYRIIGQGQPVFLVHGYGEDSRIWNNQIETLSAICQLIVLDLPGSGQSVITTKGMAEWLPKLSIDDLAECIHEIVHAEDVAPAVVLGHSMGGYIALSFARHYPNHLKALGLVHSTAYADSEEKKSVRLKSMEFIRENGGYALFKTTMVNLFGEAFRSSNPASIQELVEATKAFDPQVLIAYTRAMMQRPDRSELLRYLPQPVLFIVGPEDIAVPLTDLEQQAKIPGRSYFHIMDNVGHMGMLESPKQMNQYLSAFIQATF